MKKKLIRIIKNKKQSKIKKKINIKNRRIK